MQRDQNNVTTTDSVPILVFNYKTFTKDSTEEINTEETKAKHKGGYEVPARNELKQSTNYTANRTSNIYTLREVLEFEFTRERIQIYLEFTFGFALLLGDLQILFKIE